MDALSPGAGQPAAVSRRGPLRRLASWYLRHVWVATALLIVVIVAAGFVALQALTWDKVGDGVTVAGVELGVWTTRRPSPSSRRRSSRRWARSAWTPPATSR